ncbi:bifunctional riboflavin kinase/FAD synthetase [Clostridium malenominatum]|uniref:Riboflavin biosynthesis protein n=1 Tax=Clostridium malenominatum TaxID=1539 RepID=A0ABP3U4P6_9CLOT
MDLINEGSINNFKHNTYIALGSFDGLHLGHSKLVNKAIELANKNNGKSMVYTFKNHPLSIINKELVPKLLMDMDQKGKVLNNMGLDYLTLVEFDENFMKLSPEDFIANIVKKYNAKSIIVGFNYRFGYKNLGDVEFLKELSKKYKFKLYVIKPVKFKKEIVSSSHIRHIIADTCDIEKATSMLTRPYSIYGKVIKGKQLGRVLGFPTVNLDYNKEYLIPRGGVYFTIVEYSGLYYKGVTNVGYNPTVEDGKLSIETHILDFNKDVYGEELRIHFIHRIRDEKKFNSLDELALRVSEDKKYVIKQNLELIIKSNLQL